MASRVRNHWGWGYEDEQLPFEEVRAAAGGLAQHLGFGASEPERPVALDAIALPAPRLAPPPSLAEICSTDHGTRVRHAYGRAYRDVVRGFRGRIDHAPDVVARPREEREVEQLLEWAAAANAAVIPFGGGTSVVGGVEARVGGGFDGALTLDLTALDRVLEVDTVSRAARIQAGVLGPDLEAQLAPHALTLRHFPQSFQLSTLGGWIATRAGGHFATGADAHRRPRRVGARDHAGRRVGVAAAARLRRRAEPRPPAARLRGDARRDHRGVGARAPAAGPPRWSCGPASATSPPARRPCGRSCSRGCSRRTAACSTRARLRLTFAGDGSSALLVLGFESAEHEVEERMTAALAICAQLGGTWEARGEGARGGAVGSWREAFLRAPYLRDTLVAMGVLSETFETAITWERFDGFCADVRAAVRAAVRDACGAEGIVTCRITHAYPDGAAPYFTVLAPARRGEEVDQWDAIKRAAGDAVLAGGGTITHHHAVGRDHRPWYDAQRPAPFAAALRGAKAAVDPAGILNPGVLFGQ